MSITRVYWIIFISCHFCHIYYRYIYYVHSFFIFNCNVFSAFHAKHFEMRNNILWNWWVEASSLNPSSDVIFWVLIVNPFSFLCSIFFLSRGLCFLWSPCLSLITKSISLDTSGKPTVGFFLNLNNIFNLA